MARQLQEDMDGQTLTLSVGEEFTIQLGENRTTGYGWNIGKNGASVCVLLADAYAAADGPPGSAGQHTWRFQIVRAGQAEIRLEYGRTWEREVSPARTFGLQVEAQDRDQERSGTEAS